MSRALGAAAFACLLAHATTSYAEEEGSAASREQFRKAFDAMQAQDWVAARTLLLELWNQSPRYEVAGLLGEAENRLGNHAAAAQYFAFALDNMPFREKEDSVEQVRRAHRAMKERVATIRFEVWPESAEVRVDGQPVNISPLPKEVYVRPGARTFAALRDGKRVVEHLEVAAGKEYEVALRFPEEDAASGASTLSGTETGETPAAPPRITVEDRGSGQRSMVPVYVGAGLTAVGLGAWIGFGIDAGNAREDASAIRGQTGPTGCASGVASSDLCSRAEDTFERQRRSSLVANVGMGVALTAGVATVAYWLFWPERREEPNGVAVRPSFGFDRQGGSVGLAGEF